MFFTWDQDCHIALKSPPLVSARQLLLTIVVWDNAFTHCSHITSTSASTNLYQCQCRLPLLSDSKSN